MKAVTQLDYREKLEKLLRYIEKTLDQKLSLEHYAQYAAFSPYHFHRIFSVMVGESLSSYIRRLRLEWAANLLITCQREITEIALEAGFENSSSFGKSFKKMFHLSPSEFRQNGVYIKESSPHLKSFNQEQCMEFEIVNCKPWKVMCVRKTGPYDKAAEQAWAELCRFAFPKGLVGPRAEMIGISYDNPDITDSDKLRYDACITTDKDLDLPSPFFMQEVEGGTYARFMHLGSYQQLINSYRYIYGQWMQEYKKELRECPCFELYLNSPDSTPEDKLKTWIYIPLKD